MLHPEPTTKLPPHVCRAKLLERVAATATSPEYIVIGSPNTSYRTRLVPAGEIECEIGKRIEGVIHAKAKRVDVVTSGGRYIEPVFGRPRRVQGSVVAIDEAANAIVVSAGFPVVAALTDRRQKASGFGVGDFVSFDVLRGATFTQLTCD